MSGSADKLETTIVRDDRGRLLPGTAALNQTGRRGRSASASDTVRRRYRSEEHKGTLVELVETLEDIALDRCTSAVRVTARDRIAAVVHLLKLHDGRKAFDHDGADEETPIAEQGASRNFFSCDEVDRQVEALARGLGIPAEELPKFLDAALAWADAQDDLDDEPTDDDLG